MTDNLDVIVEEEPVVTTQRFKPEVDDDKMQEELEREYEEEEDLADDG